MSGLGRVSQKRAWPDFGPPPIELGSELFFVVTRPLGQHIGEEISLPLCSFRFINILAIFHQILVIAILVIAMPENPLAMLFFFQNVISLCHNLKQIVAIDFW